MNPLLQNPLLQAVYEIQEATLLMGRSFGRALSKPYYFREIIMQMDTIGFGSLMIIILTGGFTGGVLALQTGATLQTFGATGVTGTLVMTSMVREMGPVLASLMLAGRVGSAIAAELGSMVVSEQVDAMRALGSDPVKKLVWPRVLALLVMTPALTLVADIVGAFGGWLVASALMNVASSVYISSAKDALTYNDIVGGLIKPAVFGLIIAVVSCRAGLRTYGGTVGVGRSTTQAVVVSDILILVADFFLSRLILAFSGS
jgi:phospholipid/cholesterol/gamma-HCH transport system permease protein